MMFFKYKKLVIFTLIAVFAIAFFSFNISLAETGVPTNISYQGTLTDSGGNPLGGAGTSYYFKFSIWDSPVVGSGNKLWPTSAPGVTNLNVRQGIFNVNIGDTDNGYPDVLDYNFNTNSKVYLQVEVSSDNVTFETLTPRSSISSSAFAQVSNQVNGLGQSSFGTSTPFLNTVISAVSRTVNDAVMSIKGIAEQVANLFNIFDASGNSLFTVSAGGNVGIGAASPLNKLTVAGTILSAAGTSNTLLNGSQNQTGLILLGNGAYWGIRQSTSQAVNFDVYNSGSPLTALSILQTGNIGIGTASPNFKLDVGGTVATYLGGGTQSYIGGLSSNSDGTGHVQMYNANAGSMSDFRFSVLNDTKDQYLSFVGTSNAYSANLFGSARNTSMYIFSNSLGGTPRNLTIGTVHAKDLVLGTNNAEVMRLTSAGNVGIGTSNPSSRLEIKTIASAMGTPFVISNSDGVVKFKVFDTAASSAYAQLTRADNAGDVGFAVYPQGSLSSSNVAWTFGLKGSANNFSIWSWDGSAVNQRFVVKNTGEVGIGTSNPSNLLSVVQSLSSDGYVMGSFGTNESGYSVKVGAVRHLGSTFPGVWMGQTTPTVTNYSFLYASGSIFNTPASTDMHFRVNNASKMTLYRDGNIGIGTTTPTNLLTISGASNQIGLYPTSGVYYSTLSHNQIDGTTGLSNTGYNVIRGSANANNVYVGRGDVMTLTYLGNVGIGTTTPGYKLDVIGGDVNIPVNQFYRVDGKALFSYYSTGNKVVLGSANAHNLTFYAGAVDRMYIDSGTGNVGIGTITPSSALNVVGVTSLQSGVGDGVLRIGADVGVTTLTSGVRKLGRVTAPSFSNAYYYSLFSADSNGGMDGIEFGGRSGAVNPSPTYISFTTTPTQGSAAGNAERMRITASGNTGIGTTTPTQKLSVVGNAQFTGVTSGTYAYDLNLTSDGILTTSASDERLKDNIVSLNASSTLLKITQLNPVSFNWKNNNTPDVGLIAQQVESIFPELVFENPTDGYKGVNYSRLITLLVSAVQEVARNISGFANEFVTKTLRSDKVETKTLCIDDLCINKDQLQNILQNNNIAPGSVANPVNNQTSDSASTSASVSGDTDIASSTESGTEIPTETSTENVPIENITTEEPPVTPPTQSDIPVPPVLDLPASLPTGSAE